MSDNVEQITLEIGKPYNWKNQPEKLLFRGHNFSGNGFWYQFVLVEKPDEIWCECLASDLSGIEPTKS